MKILNNLLILLATGSCAFSQMHHYDYKQELRNVDQTWHSLVLPDAVFGSTQQSLNDIRIYGITAENDTIEVPYLLRKRSKAVKTSSATFKKLNETKNANGYFFTFEIASEEPINHIHLDFDNKNFDWKIKLEGSNDNSEWFTLVEGYRIVSLVNASTNYQFTDLRFPQAKFHYYRLTIPANKKPQLTNAQIALTEVSDAFYNDFSINKLQTENSSESKQTVVEVHLDQTVAASFLQLEVAENFDYYRPLRIQYMADSIKTEKGWRYNYNNLFTGTLSSIDTDGFDFPSTSLRQLKIIIDNNDNEPLTITGAKIKGYKHELIARFTKDASYFLVYGNDKAVKPRYDIEQFTNSVPQQPALLELDNPMAIRKAMISKTPSLFENKAWLWAIMGIVSFVLGYFSLKMLKK